jgi:YegS/Rv2252/BmrU family lipid kinase
MFITKYYLLGALLFTLLAYIAPNVLTAVISLWIALSLALVSIAYLANKPAIFRKNSDGKIPTYIRWAFIPFLIGVSAYNYFVRKKDAVPPIQKIEDGLYLSRRLLPSDLELLKQQDITAILDVTAEFEGLESSSHKKAFDYLNIPVLDHCSPSTSTLLHAIRWIKSQKADGKSVVIHCALGRGRSVFVLAAYLLTQNNELSVDQVLENINAIRSTANLNKSQRKSLQTFDYMDFDKTNKTLCMVINPVSGGGKWQLYRSEVIRQLTMQYTLQIKTTTPDISAKSLALEAKEQNIETIIVGGGDGTVTEVASVLVNTDIKLGILPLGTANALCHVLYGIKNKLIPVKAACDAILNNHATAIDTVRCNDKLMLLMLGIGFEHEMIDYAERDEKNKDGQLAYLKGFFGALNEGEAQEVSIRVNDGKAQHLTINSLAVANTTPFISLLAQSNGRDSATDGKLHITYIPHSDAAVNRMLSISQLALSGVIGNVNTEQVSYIKAKKVELSSDKDIHYVIDGELFTGSQLQIEIEPKSLQVLMP